MKLTKKGHYAVKALVDLSLQANSAPSAVSQIALRQDIPAPFLEKLLIRMRQAGLINSIRGAKGGYQLAHSPQEITLGQILLAVGENLESIPLLQDEATGADWVTVTLWRKINEKMQESLNHITLADLYYDARSRQASQGQENNFII
ncbi:MAG: RrF2 family transcriptional regulator [Cyanobacterium sp. T60_A2020_053]|nr:RrF2 family transcriptional regulator [Cyanobacterium sp. T60_A2020_053]